MEIFFTENAKKDLNPNNESHFSIFICIFNRKLEKKTITIDVKPKEIFEIIRLKIFEKEVILPKIQTLCYFDNYKDIDFWFIDIHRNIAEFNIKNESTLSLFIYKLFDLVEEEKQETLEFPKCYSIFVRTLSGMILTLNVSSFDEIRTIKTIIEKK